MKKKNFMPKTIMDAGATLTFSVETSQKAADIKAEIEAITKDASVEQLLDYIKKSGTPVVRRKNAAKALALISEEEGLITELQGFSALYVNILSGRGFSLASKPIFILRPGELNRFGFLHQFYKWYSLKSGMPGFDFRSQKLFKQYLRAKFSDNLNLDTMLGLKEAIARDKEATDWAYALSCAQEGSKQAFDRLNSGGASV